jgi:type II secretion system protein D
MAKHIRRGGSFGRVSTSAVVAAALVASAGVPRSVWADDPGTAPAVAPAVPPSAPAKPAADGKIRFSFKDAPLDQVIDFFARESGLPVIFEAAVPAGQMTFVSTGEYSFEEALSILNQNLMLKGVQLRKEKEFLYLAELKDAAKRATPVVNGKVPDEFTADKMMTLTLSLENSQADKVAAQIKDLIGPYGAVTAVPIQNMVIVMETAAQCRRIADIVKTIDSVKPVDSTIRLFTLQFAQAKDVLAALKSLTGERRRTVLVEKDNQQRVVEDLAVTGVSMTADERTNSILVVGPAARVRVVEDLIKLLDTPGGMVAPTGPGQVASDENQMQMVSVVLAGMTADDAAAKVNTLYAAMNPKTKPVVIPLPEQSKITLVGPKALITQGVSLLAEIDPKSAVGGNALPPLRGATIESRTAILRPRGVTAGQIEAIAAKLLGGKQASNLRYAPTPDGLGIIVRGPDDEVAEFEKFVAGIDNAPKPSTKVIDLQHAQASAIVEPLKQLLAAANPLGSGISIDAIFTPIDRTNSLVVVADEATQSQVADFIKRLDRIESSELPPLQILPLKTANAAEVASMLSAQYGQRSQTDRSSKPVEIKADPSSNSLIVSAAPEPLEAIKSFVDELNKEKKQGRASKIFPLKSARAADVAAALDKLYPIPPVPLDRQGRPMPWAQQPKEITVTAETQSNSLIVDAPSERLDSIAELVSKLDRVELPAAAQIRTYRVTGANLQTVTQTLNQLARLGLLSEPAKQGAPAVQVMVESEPKSGTLIVAGDDMTFTRVETILKELQAVPVEKSLRIFTVLNNKASEVRDRALAIYQGQIAQIPDANPVEITVDESKNSLAVVADATGMERIAKILDELQKQAGPAREVRLIELKLAKAADVAKFLKELSQTSGALRVRGGPELVVEVLESTNSIMVAATAEQLAVIDPMVRSLDVAKEGAAQPLSIIKVKSSDAANLAQMLSKTYDQRPQDERAKKPVKIDADLATNTLLVSAPPEVATEIERIVESLNDTQKVDATGREIRIFPLKIVRAEDLARTIDQMYPDPPIPRDPRNGQPRPDLKQPKEITVRADVATNALIVDAPSKRMAGFEELVKSLDTTKSADSHELKTYSIQRGEPNAVATALRNLAASGALGAASSGKVTVDVEPGTKSLIVSGPKEIFAQVDSVVKQLDGGDAADRPQTTLRMFPLKNARAVKLQPIVEKMLLSRLRDQFAAEGKNIDPKSLIEVAADTGSNTLLITAPSAIGTVADALVQSLDRQSVDSAADVRVIKLKRAEAQQVSTAIKTVLALDPAATENPPTITAEPSSNTIVLAGTAAIVERCGKLIEQMDVVSDSGGQSVRTLYLKNARAEALAPVLQGMLERENPVDKLPEWQRAQYLSRINPKDQPQPVKVNAEPRLNALLVSGPSAVIELAQELVKELDVDPKSRGIDASRPLRIITLINADAAALAQSIDALFKGADAGGTPPMVKVDAASNSLIVRATAEQMTQIEELSTKLDKATLSSSRQMRMVPVDKSRADAELMARTVRRLMEQQSGVKVNVVSSEELLKKQTGEDDPKKPDPQPDGNGGKKSGRGPQKDQQPLASAGSLSLPTFGNSITSAIFSSILGIVDPASTETEDVTIGVDPATNSLIILGSPRQAERLAALIAELEKQMPAEAASIHIIKVAAGTDVAAVVTAVNQTIQTLSRGAQKSLTGPVSVVADPSGTGIIVVANKTDFEVVGKLVASLAENTAGGLPIRTIKLDRANAETVAASITTFLNDRVAAQQRAGMRGVAKVSILGDRRSGLLTIAAGDEDFATIEKLAKQFDTPAESQNLQFKILPLKNARVNEISSTIQNVISELQWDRQWNRRGQENPGDRLFLEANEAMNAFVVVGEGESLAAAERIITQLDVPQQERSTLVVKSMTVEKADLLAIKNVIERAMSTPGWRSWRGPDPDGVAVEIDRSRRALIFTGKKDRVDQAMGYARDLSSTETKDGLAVEAITLEHARADRAAQNLKQFFAERAQAMGLNQSGVSIIGSSDGNVLFISADPASLKELKALVTQIDQPELGPDRRVALHVLKNANPSEMAATIKAMFPDTSAKGGRIVAIPQPTINAVLISAPQAMIEQVTTVVKSLDEPPTKDAAKITTVTLNSSRSADVATALRQALPPSVKVTITPLPRSNALLLTGSDEAVALVMEQIRKIDTEPLKAVVSFKRFVLKNAAADELAYTLREMLRSRPSAPGEPSATIDWTTSDNSLAISAPADQLTDIERMINDLDVPSTTDRRTDFVKLQFANAEQVSKALGMFYGRYASEAKTPGARSVSIVPDPASNSLVISADASEWDGLKALLSKLDTAEYDTSRQFEVIVLANADAVSVARAINEGLRAPLESQIRRDQARNQNRGNTGRNEDNYQPPTVLVDKDATPVVSAEVQSNSLIVFGGRQDIDRIKSIVKQLDVAEYKELPAPRVIPLKTGKPSLVAASIRELYLNRQGAEARAKGPRAVLIIGDDSSDCLIIRADDEQFAAISGIAKTLEDQAVASRPEPRVIKLANVPAGRVRDTIQKTFAPMAQQMGETLAVELDRTSNALIIAASPRLLDEINKVIAELDVPPPAANTTDANPSARLGQSFLVVDVVNNEPAEIAKQLEAMGLTRPAPADRPGMVSEPITIVPMTTRRALAIMTSPGDGKVIEELVKSLDALPANAEQTVEIVPLKVGTAQSISTTLRALMNPTDQQAQTGPAKALVEQIRRLNITRTGVDQSKLELDLSKPMKIVADVDNNALVITSTPGNVAAIKELAHSLDTLPMSGTVVVRIFPLQNAAATRVQAVLKQLFDQGESLRRIPGTQRRGIPASAAGLALAGDVAIAIDDRTNALIIAAREESVNLVESLIKDLDSEEVSNWIEPVIVPLQYASAADMASKLRQVLVQGFTTTPDALGLQKMYGRLRMAQQGKKFGEPGSVIEGEMFAPVTGLVLVPDEQLNALIVVGSPGNTAIVKELVKVLDVEKAAASNQVQMFPLVNAGAERVAAIIRNIFSQREGTGAMREEDRVVITADVRTNSLIIATSGKSFAIIEGLLKKLDGERTNYSVGFHIVPVQDVDVRQLAPRIERLMRERLAAASRAGEVSNPEDAFSIDAEPINNLLIVACSDENLGVIQELIKTLGDENARVASTARQEIIQLSRTPAAEAVTSLRQMYVDREVARRGQAAVAVNANERLNAIVVSGSENDITQIRKLVEQIDGADTKMIRVLERIELKSANALEVVNVLENVLGGRPVSGQNGIGARQATRLQFFRDTVKQSIEPADRKLTEADIDGVIKDQVNITPDLRSNSVVVNAPPKIVALLREIITDLDDNSSGARKIEMFPLRNADARQMAALLQRVFRLEQQGNALVLVPNKPNDPDQLPNTGPDALAPDLASGGIANTTVTAVPDQRQQLSIAIDSRTNTVIASGTEEYLTLVRDLINKLDSIEANERVSEVYELKNAKAKDVETTLKAYFSGESSLIRTRLSPEQGDSTLKQLEQEVTIIGDDKSNKLVISTSPRYIKEVRNLVEELDASPPQVLIQVLVAEVSLDASGEWGMDAKVGPFGGMAWSAGYLGGGSGVQTALGVPNLSVSTTDFQLLVRALEQQGKLEVLSEPQILVNNNTKAQIQVGENIAIVQGVERTPQGSTRSDVERKDVGIILDVTPSISSDGFVKMEIKPEISTVSNSVTPISADFQAPVINKRTVDTVVTVKDGQSVVIGGLIQSTEEKRKTKVPLLGDIPGLGMIFRTSKNTTRKTELLMILTPRVVMGRDAKSIQRIENTTDRAIERLADPTKVREYLDRIGDQDPPGTVIQPQRPSPMAAPASLPAAAPASSMAPSKRRRNNDPLPPDSY